MNIWLQERTWLLQCATHWLLTDKSYILRGLSTFLDIVTVLLVVFCNLNITYLPEAAGTIDFMQRYDTAEMWNFYLKIWRKWWRPFMFNLIMQLMMSNVTFRCFLLINPETGTKPGKPKSQKRHISGIHPNVLALLTKMRWQTLNGMFKCQSITQIIIIVLLLDELFHIIYLWYTHHILTYAIKCSKLQVLHMQGRRLLYVSVYISLLNLQNIFYKFCRRAKAVISYKLLNCKH